MVSVGSSSVPHSIYTTSETSIKDTNTAQGASESVSDVREIEYDDETGTALLEAYNGEFKDTIYSYQINTKDSTNTSAVENTQETAIVNAVQTENSETVSEVENLEAEVTSVEHKTYTMEEARAILADYDNKIADLQAKIGEYDSVINELKRELEAEQKKYDEAEQNYNTQEEYYNNLARSYEEGSSKYTKLQSQITDASKQSGLSVEEQRQAFIDNAEAKYNPDEDGDYNTYLSNALLGFSANTSTDETLIKSLNTQAANLNIELDGISAGMSSAKSKMSAYKTDMQNAKTNINNIKNKLTQQEGLKAAAVSELSTLQNNLGEIALASLSPEEKALVSANNIDLTEKMSDGSPKYILAMGRSDGLYHIYEMNGDGNGATSLARQYADGNGYDIVASGNGYIHDMGDSSSSAINDTVISLSSVNSDLTECESEKSQKTYTTCSPLSLDMNGDGVRTSNKLIQYDIDGDGEVDTINDAADAVLVFDANGDGNSGSSGLECFGNNTDLDGDGKPDGFKDGFQALKAFAAREGLINENKTVLNSNDIKYLEENFGFKVKMGGYNDEAVSLLDAGVTEIDLAKGETTNLMKNFDGQNNDIMTQDGATFTLNGEKRDYADIWHAKK